MQRFFLILVGLVLASATAQAQSNCNTFGQIDVVSCVSTRPAPPAANNCNYGQVDVCVREGTIRTDEGRATVNLNSRNVITNSANSHINVRVSTDKTRYRTGETLNVTVNLNQSGYLYIYNIDASGKITMLFPNRYSGGNYISSGRTTFPRSQDNFYYQLAGQTGTERVIAIASTNPNFDLSRATNYRSNATFATSDSIDSFGTNLYKGLEVVTVNSNVGLKEWDTATITFTHKR